MTFLVATKAYIGFDELDEARLADLHGVLAPYFPAVIESFYEAVLFNEGTAAVLAAQDEGTVERLKQTLRTWLEGALLGPWDENYYQLRYRIGRMHVKVGLPQQYVVTAMHRLRVLLGTLARDGGADAATERSLHRMLDLELAIMLHSYIEEKDRAHSERSYLERELRKRFEGPLVGIGKGVEWLRDQIDEAAKDTSPVLLTGDQGVGLDSVAHAIHEQSERAHRLFVHVNCSIAGGGSRTTLFGGTPGNWPDGKPAIIGQFDLARGGTLFLDGVHRLGTEAQTELMENLREADAGGAGGRVRVIASGQIASTTTTQRPRLNEELRNYIDARRIRVPSLAERREDIPAIAAHYAREQAARLNKTFRMIEQESLDKLQAYPWPGNVTELESVIERAVIAARSEDIEIDDALLDDSISMGNYKLVERIGSGGMGEVWRARHQLLARPAAVKIIKAATIGEGEHAALMTARFQREAQTTAGLSSPNTVQLYDFGIAQDGAFYYVMELLHGMDLEFMVEQHGPLPAARVLHLMKQACLSLAEAHDAGLVHRDIKPANLYAARLGRQCDVLKVLDFGMVKVDPTQGHTKLTSGGSFGGTPAYMPPELIVQDDESDTDGRADLYSLGCAAFFLLTGDTVFPGSNPMRVLMDHAQKAPQSPSARGAVDVPDGLDDLILACLAKDPTGRPASAMALHAALAALAAEHPWTHADATTWWSRLDD
ncbi:MAG: sigma 54-interacting transcriptional regulator [Planctomycetota bacterium]|nr:sigma 54-interacting transcriptional regulator [Planctomycetota bacterium]